MGRALALGTLLRDALSVPYWLYTTHVTEDDVSDAPEADELKVAWYVSCVVIRGAGQKPAGHAGLHAEQATACRRPTWHQCPDLASAAIPSDSPLPAWASHSQQASQKGHAAAL